MTVRKALLRTTAISFFALAALQWFSDNMFAADAVAVIRPAGWLWTVLIAAPGCLLWGMTAKRYPVGRSPRPD
jgi:hypothetical protein